MSTTRGELRPAAATALALAAIAMPFGPAPTTANVDMPARITSRRDHRRHETPLAVPRSDGQGSVRGMHAVGLVLHPRRDSAEAVDAVMGWAARRKIAVVGIEAEISRLNCAAVPVTAEELGRRCDLVVSLGGDGTVLRALRLADRQRAPVLGVNLGKLGFLAEVDVPELAGALSAIDGQEFTVEPRLAVDAVLGGQVVTAFNDVALVRFPGQATAAVTVRAAGHPFVSYAA